MMHLAEYRPNATLLADHLPWAALVAPGVVLNKDGSFQRSFRFRGPDLDSATDGELLAACARVNNVLRRFGSGWALFFEAERHVAPDYPRSDFPDAAAWLVDQERRAAFQGEPLPSGSRARLRLHHESRYFLTLTWLPPADEMSRLQDFLLERPKGEPARSWRERLEHFLVETGRAADLLGAMMPEFVALDDAATLEYLHNTVSPQRHRLTMPDPPVYLDGLLVDTAFTGGLEPMLGEQHLRTLTLLGFPDLTRPGLLDELNQLTFAYRWMSRFIALDKPAAQRELMRLRRQWFAKRKSVLAILREVLYNEPAPLIDSDAENKAADADAALQALGGDHVSFGYLTITVTVWDRDRDRAEQKLRAAEKIIHAAGFATIRESVNAVEAWLGSLPGHLYANIRQPLVHTLNLAHMMPLSGIWAGPDDNPHLDGPPLLIAKTRGATPFRLSTHIGDVGHMMIVGPTGAGKSVLLALMALQFRRYGNARIVIFDKGGSARAAVLAMAGQHYRLGLDGEMTVSLQNAAPDRPAISPSAFQPLRLIDHDPERSWAVQWLIGLLRHDKIAVTPQVKDMLWSALNNLSSAPAAERTLTGLTLLLQSHSLKAALQPYTLDGPFGALLDADDDRLAFGDVTCFEMEQLMQQQGLVLPVLTYLFHRLEAIFDGRPTLLVLDEAWLFLDQAEFAAQIRAWLKTLRKRNVAVVFATQSLSDIATSQIAPAIIESCPQRIFLANDRAGEPQLRDIYERFGLNARQIALIADAEAKRDYYLQSRRGNRLFELGLGPVALALCAAGSPDDHAAMDRLLAEAPSDRFLARWLEVNDLAWAAELADAWPAQHAAPAGRHHHAAMLRGGPAAMMAASAVAATFETPA